MAAEVIEKQNDWVLLLRYAAMLPSGLNDAQAAEKLLRERAELVAALEEGDRVGALTEAADAAYYAVKHLDWVARQVGLTVEQVLKVGATKYALRARPGNPKDDAIERRYVAAVVDSFED